VDAVIWSPAAVAQLRAIRVYLEQFNPRAAGEVAAHLLSVGNGLESFRIEDDPCRGPKCAGGDVRGRKRGDKAPERLRLRKR
jgi:hypothetical protein